MPINLSTDFSGSCSTTPTTADLLTRITEGTDVTNRLGRSIFVKDVRFAMTFEGGQSGTAGDDQWNVIRMLLYDGVVGISLPPAVSVYSVWSPFAVGGLLETYHDKCTTLCAITNFSSGFATAAKHVEWIVPINRVYTFASTSAAATPKSLFLTIVSDSAAPPYPSVSHGEMVVTFYDD